MSKTVSKLSEDGKVAIRNVRRDAMKQVLNSTTVFWCICFKNAGKNFSSSFDCFN